MATVSLTPSRCWQVDYGTVTELNPTSIYLKASPVSGDPENNLERVRAVLYEFVVPSDAAYRHGIISEITVKNTYNTYSLVSRVNYYKNNGLDLEPVIGKTFANAGDLFGYNLRLSPESDPEYNTAQYPVISAANGKIYIFGSLRNQNQSNAYADVKTNSLVFQTTYAEGVFSIGLSQTGGYFPASVVSTLKAIPENSDAMITQYSVVSGTFYYKKSSAGAYTSIQFSGDSVTIPANTFEEDEEYNYYVTATADDGSTATSEVYTMSTGDVVGTVTALYPNNMVTYGSPNFSWSYANELGNMQTAFDLQISADGANWTDIKSHEVTPNTFCTASISLGGMLYWRVRSYNQSDVASEWSNILSFTNVLPPSAPTITSVTGNGRITAQWNAANQIAYQVMIGDYDSGWIYSTEKQYFYNEYLADGAYEIKVRITNNIGLVSDWAELSYSQSGSLPGPAATVTMREGYNEISVSGSFDRYYIIRNGVVIAQIADGMYEDYYCNGNDSYIVRGVNNDDTFGDTLLTGAYTCHKPALIDPDGTITYVNERLDEQPQITSSDTADVAMVEYLGRSLPVHHVGQMQKRTWTVACSAKIKPGQIYFYRNFRGDKAWVICANVQSSLNWFGVHEYQYTLEETDYDEAVGYAV
jgi:hypothetical protein